MSIALQQFDTEEFSEFLDSAGWADATIEPFSADMGLRRYYKLIRQEIGRQKIALLMDMSRTDIAETGLKSFVNIAEYLQKNDIRVPEIYYQDTDSGLAVIEYLAGGSFGDAVKNGEDKQKLYEVATDVLLKLRQILPENTLNLPGYKETLIWNRLGQFVDYYMPIATGRKTGQADHDEYQEVWAKIEKSLSSPPMGFCHADYHLENLVYMPDSEQGYGLIDFQDAFWGFNGYDLVNLLEDARQSVPEDIKSVMKKRYCAGMSEEERQIFDDWYTVLSAQFHCRVIGLFIKFSSENETKEFLAHIPRLQGYLKNNLENPVLSPLKEFVERHNISLNIVI